MSVTVAVPKNITVEDINSESISVSVEEFVSEAKPVKLYPGEAPEGYETTVVSLGAETVQVKGAQSDVAKISFVRTEIDAKTLDTDVLKTVSVPTFACDESGNVSDSVVCAEAEIEYTAAVFTTKQVQLSTEVTGISLYGHDGVEKIEKPTAVTIKGSAEVLNGISVIETNAIDLTGISVNKTVELKCQLPDGVYLSKTVGPLRASIKISEEAKAAYEAALNMAQNNENTGE